MLGKLNAAAAAATSHHAIPCRYDQRGWHNTHTATASSTAAAAMSALYGFTCQLYWIASGAQPKSTTAATAANRESVIRASQATATTLA